MAWAHVGGGRGAQPFGAVPVGNTEVRRNNPEAWEEARVKAGEVLGG